MDPLLRMDLEFYMGRTKMSIAHVRCSPGSSNVDGMTQLPIAGGKIILSVPTEILSEAILAGSMQSIITALNDFVAKHIPEEWDKKT